MTEPLAGSILAVREAIEDLDRWCAERNGSRFGTVLPLYTNCPAMPPLIDAVRALLAAARDPVTEKEETDIRAWLLNYHHITASHLETPGWQQQIAQEEALLMRFLAAARPFATVSTVGRSRWGCDE